ncbi:hypothetical protein [Pseudoduganella sp. OTU4001]|uniref:hypothetical protein n=1 Tax=Pseudoduganella sp. OTU4001 TaxID=3043854 RepID=UPI00313ED4F9
MKAIFLAAGLAATSTLVIAAEPVQTRDIPIENFMGAGRLPLPIDLKVPVPVEYMPAKIKKMGYQYWMRPADAATATAQQLPNRNGYIYGSTATNVTYDVRTKMFYGIDDPGSLNKLQTAATKIKVTPLKEGKHPAVLVQMISNTTGQPAYFMYMATGRKNEVFFLSFRAPDGRPDIGDAVWAKLAANIK